MKKLIVILFTILMLSNSFGIKNVLAEGKTVKEEGKELPSDYDKMSLTLVDDDEIDHHSGTYEDIGEKGNDMSSGPYVLKFSFSYYGTPLIAEVTVSQESFKSIADGAYSKAFIDSSNLLQVGWYHADVVTKWNIKIFDAEGTSYLKYFLIGFDDPDESDYEFTTVGRNIYYQDAKSTDGATDLTAAQYFVVDNGFKRKDGVVYTFDQAIFVVSALASEKTFSFKSLTPNEGALQVPHIYSKNYNIYYDLNDANGTKATIEPGNAETYASSPKVFNNIVKNPTRDGYDFLGWKETDSEFNPISDEYVTSIPAEESGDKYFKAFWTPHKYNVVYVPNSPAGTPGIAEDNVPSGETEAQPERIFDNKYSLNPNGFALKGYKFKGWSLTEGVQPVEYENNAEYINLTTVDNGTAILYAQWDPIEYMIKYNPNEPSDAQPASGEMADDTPRYFDVDYKLTGNKYAVDGYDFVGWSTEPGVKDVVYPDLAPYKNLVEEDGGVVTLFAQWKPWIYTIKYDANGGEGTMDNQIFDYFDSSMESKENAFYRDGYRFAGFDYEYNGVKYHINDHGEFVEKLKALGHYGEITLVAQWVKNPAPIDVPYTIPVTGVE